MFTCVAEVTFVPLCDLYRHVTRDTCVADVTFVPAPEMVRCVVSPNLSWKPESGQQQSVQSVLWGPVSENVIGCR